MNPYQEGCKSAIESDELYPKNPYGDSVEFLDNEEFKRGVKDTNKAIFGEPITFSDMLEAIKYAESSTNEYMIDKCYLEYILIRTAKEKYREKRRANG